MTFTTQKPKQDSCGSAAKLDEMCEQIIRLQQPDNPEDPAHCCLETGRLLIEAKAIVPRGKWTKWLHKNFDGSVESARSLMKLSRQGFDFDAIMDRLLGPMNLPKRITITGEQLPGGSASVDEIHATYRRLARVTHPDNGGDAEEFKRLDVWYQRAIARHDARISTTEK